MTQAQLDHVVARHTGESLRTVRRLGFRLQAGPAADLEPEELHLAVDCPACGRPVPLHRGPADPTATATCGRCAAYFAFEARAVYAAGPAGAPARDTDAGYE